MKVRIEFPKQEAVKYLGVTVDKEFNWKQHIGRVYKKSLACLASIRRTWTYIPFLQYQKDALFITSASLP